MISFKRFLLNECITINAPYGIFVKVTPTNDTIRRLCGYFYEFEYHYPLLDDFHCTTLYSDKPAYDIELPNVDKNARYYAIGKKLLHWPGQKGEGYIVLELESPDLQTLHKKFADAGFKATFPDYTPHVSLIHPVSDFEKIKELFDKYNELLYTKKDPLKLEFYYGGYTISDEEKD